MAGKWPNIQTEFVTCISKLKDLFKSLTEFANDPDKPAPDFNQPIQELEYPDNVGYTTWHNADNPSYANGSVQDNVHRWEALKRENDMRRTTRKDYYEAYKKYVQEESAYMETIFAKNRGYMQGTNPRQGGKGS